METKNIFQTNIVEKKDNVFKYVPSSSEKKRAIMMYLFFGIMVSITKKEINIFEYHHLKQATGRWIVFLLVLVFDVVLLFLPIIKYLGLIPLLILLVSWVVIVKQAREGNYFVNKKNSSFAIFSSIGSWFIELFEINLNIPQSNLSNSDEIIDKAKEELTSKSDIEIDIQKN